MVWSYSRTPGAHVMILPPSFPQTQCNFFFPLPNICKIIESAESYGSSSRAACTLTCCKALSCSMPHSKLIALLFTWYMGWSSIARCEIRNLHNLKRPTRHKCFFLCGGASAKIGLFLWWEGPSTPLIAGLLKTIVIWQTPESFSIYLLLPV